MRAIIFSGPSLPPSAIPKRPEIEWRPPLRQGDLRRAATEQPNALGVIDGYFEITPTVWHEEILFALDRRIGVYGAASIGALRAAEMHVFGMRGIGRIFKWFRDGLVEDDDEVALLHGPPDLDFPALTEAMVNVRATVANAVQNGVIPASTGSALTAVAKGMFYKRRTWDGLLEQARGGGIPHEELDRTRAWLRAGRVDQKRADACLMLQSILQDLSGDRSR